MARKMYFVLVDDYFVTDFVAWNVAFESDVEMHAPLFNTTLMVVVVV